jgi:hypothetical protein
MGRFHPGRPNSDANGLAAQRQTPPPRYYRRAVSTALGVAILVVALVSAVGAVAAARFAASASTKTARLAAQLTDAGELQKWQRQEFLTLVSEFLAAGHKHRLSADALLRPTAAYSRPRNAVAGQELREFELKAWKLSLVASESVQSAGNDLYLRHLAAAAEYTSNGPRDANRWALLIDDIVTAQDAFVAAARLQLGADRDAVTDPWPQGASNRTSEED